MLKVTKVVLKNQESQVKMEANINLKLKGTVTLESIKVTSKDTGVEYDVSIIKMPSKPYKGNRRLEYVITPIYAVKSILEENVSVEFMFKNEADERSEWAEQLKFIHAYQYKQIENEVCILSGYDNSVRYQIIKPGETVEKSRSIWVSNDDPEGDPIRMYLLLPGGVSFSHFPKLNITTAKDILKKSGLFRKHVYGSRGHITLRSVVTSIAGSKILKDSFEHMLNIQLISLCLHDIKLGKYVMSFAAQDSNNVTRGWYNVSFAVRVKQYNIEDSEHGVAENNQNQNKTLEGDNVPETRKEQNKLLAVFSGKVTTFLSDIVDVTNYGMLENTPSNISLDASNKAILSLVFESDVTDEFVAEYIPTIKATASGWGIEVYPKFDISPFGGLANKYSGKGGYLTLDFTDLFNMTPEWNKDFNSTVAVNIFDKTFLLVPNKFQERRDVWLKETQSEPSTMADNDVNDTVKVLSIVRGRLLKIGEDYDVFKDENMLSRYTVNLNLDSTNSCVITVELDKPMSEGLLNKLAFTTEPALNPIHIDTLDRKALVLIGVETADALKGYVGTGFVYYLKLGFSSEVLREVMSESADKSCVLNILDKTVFVRPKEFTSREVAEKLIPTQPNPVDITNKIMSECHADNTETKTSDMFKVYVRDGFGLIIETESRALSGLHIGEPDFSGLEGDELNFSGLPEYMFKQRDPKLGLANSDFEGDELNFTSLPGFKYNNKEGERKMDVKVERFNNGLPIESVAGSDANGVPIVMYGKKGANTELRYFIPLYREDSTTVLQYNGNNIGLRTRLIPRVLLVDPNDSALVEEGFVVIVNKNVAPMVTLGTVGLDRPFMFLGTVENSGTTLYVFFIIKANIPHNVSTIYHLHVDGKKAGIRLSNSIKFRTTQDKMLSHIKNELACVDFVNGKLRELVVLHVMDSKRPLSEPNSSNLLLPGACVEANEVAGRPDTLSVTLAIGDRGTDSFLTDLTPDNVSVKSINFQIEPLIFDRASEGVTLVTILIPKCEFRAMLREFEIQYLGLKQRFRVRYPNYMAGARLPFMGTFDGGIGGKMVKYPFVSRGGEYPFGIHGRYPPSRSNPFTTTYDPGRNRFGDAFPPAPELVLSYPVNVSNPMFHDLLTDVRNLLVTKGFGVKTVVGAPDSGINIIGFTNPTYGRF